MNPLLKRGSILEVMNLLPHGEFFSFRVEPFSEEKQNNFESVITPEGVSVPLKYSETQNRL